MKAIIFNSGMGSRMGNLTSDKPKCMVELYNGETIFERQIRVLSECGITEFIVTTGPYREFLIDVSNKYKNLKIDFVENKDYKNTNYIVSMNNCYDLIDDNVLLMHGDLVFNKNLIKKILENENESVCLYNEIKNLPQKDFKGRFLGNKLKEVSISIFDKDCFAFQPLYKLSKNDIFIWKNKVREFVQNGQVTVYAENALNEVTDKLNIIGMSYKDDYIDEIDNKDDYERVSCEIKYFDYLEQKVEITDSYINNLSQYIDLNDEIFVVSGKHFTSQIKEELNNYNITIFNEFSPNPKYEEIKYGLEMFKSKQFNKIIAIGGGSTIDVAKIIKLFSSLKNENDFLEKKYVYNRIKLIAIPTTAGTGSESTQFAVMYYNGEKISIDHGSILPNVAILDYSIFLTLPDYQKKSCLLDSMCQVIESYWSKNATEQSKKYSKECIKNILTNYIEYIENNEKSYKNMMIASNYSGKAINITRTTSAHAMSYKITSMYNISHGHAVALCIIPIWKLLAEKSKNNDELKNILLEISNLFEKGNNIDDSINFFENMVNSFNLPKVPIREEDIIALSKSVNIERMKNNPVEFTFDEISYIYREIFQNTLTI